MNQPSFSRRQFLAQSSVSAAALWVGHSAAAADKKQPLFKISLAQWTINRELKSGKIDNLDFATVARSRHLRTGIRESILHGQGERQKVPQADEEASC